MSRAFVQQLCLSYRRMYGKTSLQALLEKFGIDEWTSALDQQDKHAALIAALQGKLPPDAIARAQALADALPSGNSDDIPDADEASAAATPKSLADITANAYRKWNSAGKKASA